MSVEVLVHKGLLFFIGIDMGSNPIVVSEFFVEENMKVEDIFGYGFQDEVVALASKIVQNSITLVFGAYV